MSNNVQKPEFRDIHDDEYNEQPNNEGLSTFIQAIVYYIIAIGKTAILFIVGVFFASLAVKWLGPNAYLATIFMAILIIVGFILENRIAFRVQIQNEEEEEEKK